MYNPWPGEINRQLTGRLASFHFAPTSLARENLLREGVPDDRIFVTGNTVIDALHAVVGRIKSDEALAGRLAGGCGGRDTMPRGDCPIAGWC